MDQLQDDLRSITALASQNEHKAAALVAAVVLEALVRSLVLQRAEAVAAWAELQPATRRALRDRGCSIQGRPEKWGLAGLLTAAEALGMLDANELELCRAARVVRNRMHELTWSPTAWDVQLVQAAIRPLLARAANVETAGPRAPGQFATSRPLASTVKRSA